MKFKRKEEVKKEEPKKEVPKVVEEEQVNLSGDEDVTIEDKK